MNYFEISAEYLPVNEVNENLKNLSVLQVCGRVWLPVSSWSVRWPPCSGSSTTLWRSTSVCPALLPPRCQSPWRRSWASPSNVTGSVLHSFTEPQPTVDSSEPHYSDPQHSQTQTHSSFLHCIYVVSSEHWAAAAHVYLKNKKKN